MKVFSLITVLDEDMFDSCTLSFATLRKGFPTADITLHINGNCRLKELVKEKAHKYDLPYIEFERAYFHADYIEQVVALNTSQIATPDHDHDVTIVDGDCIFWDDCEFPGDDPSYAFGGFYVPNHWNVWSDCESMPRIHPSFLRIPNTVKLLDMIKRRYPEAYKKHGEYCGFRPFHPVTVHTESGRKLFYDTMSNLTNMLSLQTLHFPKNWLDKYDHLNSASFYHEVLSRMDEDEQHKFRQIHHRARMEPGKLKGLYKHVREFYKSRSIRTLPEEGE